MTANFFGSEMPDSLIATASSFWYQARLANQSANGAVEVEIANGLSIGRFWRRSE